MPNQECGHRSSLYKIGSRQPEIDIARCDRGENCVGFIASK